MDNIVYIYIEETWNSIKPKEAENFCNWLESKTANDVAEEKICIAVRYENLTQYLWLTCTLDWLEEKYPEMKKLSTTKPQFSEYLSWKEINFGIRKLEPKNSEQDIIDRII